MKFGKWKLAMTKSITASIERCGMHLTDHISPRQRKYVYQVARQMGLVCIKERPEVRQRSLLACHHCDKPLHSINWETLEAYPCRCRCDYDEFYDLKAGFHKVLVEETWYRLRITRGVR